MPYDDPDPQDPHRLVGVSLRGGRRAMREMAFTFAEEFAALGFPPEKLLNLFRRPAYAGAHRAYLALGEPAIREIVRESVEVWGGCRFVVQEPSPEQEAKPNQLVEIGSGAAGPPVVVANEEDEPCRR